MQRVSRQVGLVERWERRRLWRAGSVCCRVRWFCAAVAEQQKPWRSLERCRGFLDDLAKERGIDSPREWAGVTTTDVRKRRGGTGLLQEHGSLLQALRFAYREEAEKYTAFSCRRRVPRGYWDSAQNQREFLDSLAESEGVTCAEDWARIGVATLIQRGGSGLLAKYCDFESALRANYPEIDFSRASIVKRTDWSAPETRRAFLDSVAEQKAISGAEGWATVTTEEIIALGGRGLLRRFPTVWAALADAYPELDSADKAVLCRPRAPRGHFNDADNVRAFLDRAAALLGIREPQDWYRVSWEQLRNVGGTALLKRTTLADALASAYPAVKWDRSAFTGGARKSSQMQLHRCVSTLLGI